MSNLSILIVVDVISALAQEETTLSKNVYLFDNNKKKGSSGEGTMALMSKVNPGDAVSWFVAGLEVETKVKIMSIKDPGGYIQSNPKS